MISPMSVDELPSFIEKNQSISQPINNPMLKYIIVGSIILLAFIIANKVISRNQQENNIKKDENNEH